MKCDELTAPIEINIPGLGTIESADLYLKSEVDAAIEELKAENERLNNALDKERSETIKYMDELCNAKNEIERLTIDKRNAELRADVADGTVEKLKAENEKLKQKLEDAKATAYTESVDAGMRERRLKRALWLARAYRAEARKNYWYARSILEGDKYLWSIDGSAVKYIGCIKRTNFDWLKIWSEVECKCRAKVDWIDYPQEKEAAK